jgi:hypothetical protein
MKKSQFYKIAAIGMLVLNISMIAFFLITRPHPPHPGEGAKFRNQALDILHLDDAQTAQFEELAGEHHEKVTEVKEKQSELLKTYFENFQADNNSGVLPSFPAEFLSLEQSKVELTYRHFLEVKTLLKPDQIDYFPDFLQEAMDVLLLEKKAHKSPPGRHKK